MGAEGLTLKGGDGGDTREGGRQRKWRVGVEGTGGGRGTSQLVDGGSTLSSANVRHLRFHLREGRVEGMGAGKTREEGEGEEGVGEVMEMGGDEEGVRRRGGEPCTAPSEVQNATAPCSVRRCWS